MKQMTLEYKNIQWHILMSVDGHGICDTTIYRLRKVQRWWQSKEEFFTDLVSCPTSMEQHIDHIKNVIDRKLEEEAQRNTFLNEYLKLEDAPYI